MTQDERILEYIEEHGSISPMEAWNDLGITKLATRVSYMRRHCGIVALSLKSIMSKQETDMESLFPICVIH